MLIKYVSKKNPPTTSVVLNLLNYEHMSDDSMWNCVELRECRKCQERVIINIHGYTCTYTCIILMTFYDGTMQMHL